jgi:hypothetical protein
VQLSIYRITKAWREAFLRLLRDVWGEVYRADREENSDCPGTVIC